MSNPRWHDAFPAPTKDISSIRPDSLADLIKNKQRGIDYIVVDVRRTDFEKSSVKGVINLPAHSFYQTIETIVDLLSSIPIVVFYCNSCSPGGRGPRSAGWYLEELTKRKGDPVDVSVMFLEGGVKGWIERFGKDESLTTLLPELVGN